MPTPSSGQISMSQIGNIVKGSATAQISLGESGTRTLFGVAASGQISITSGYNKPAAGSASYSTPGSYTFFVPVYEFLTVDVMGGSGGGGGGADNNPGFYNCGGNPGGSATESRFASSTPVVGGGGGGGGPGNNNYAGSNGNASGGDTNYVGNPSFCYGGGAGGPSFNYPSGGTGGYSGRAIKGWKHASTSGNPSWGSSITVTVGSAGAGGGGGQGAFNGFVFFCTGGRNGSSGTNGFVNMAWS